MKCLGRTTPEQDKRLLEAIEDLDMKAQAFVIFRVIFVCPKCQYENTLEPDGPTPKEADCEHCGKHVKLEYESG